MKSLLSARFAPALAAFALAAVLAGCGPEKPAPYVPPPPPPPPPPITLAPRLIEEASAWRGYMARANAISPDFQNGEQIQTSLRTAAAYEPKQFLRGAVAWAAIVALQDPTFVAELRKVAADPAARLAMRDQLIANPNMATILPGADSAAGLIMQALGNEGSRMVVNGRAVKQAAYTVQHSAWSKISVPDREGRLIAAKSLSATPMLGDAADVMLLQQASTGPAAATPLGLTPAAAPPPWSPIVVRGLTLAALAAIGEGGDANFDAITTLSAEPNAAYCLNMAKLNLYQCLAVSKPQYEDIFCLGQHILIDTGACMVKWTGATMPAEPPPPPQLVRAPPKKTSITEGPRKPQKPPVRR
ncbi:MAG: hypothetical protein HY859_15020 [Caulobacterales bacterium]|nr:hypothetical protein [Caulobacterales bacterium]